MKIYWIDPADCGEDDEAAVEAFRERVQMALPADWTAEVVGRSDYEQVSQPVPRDVERIVDVCWEDHCRLYGTEEGAL